MEILNKKYGTAVQATERFAHAVMLWHTRDMHNYSEDIVEALADSAIKRFEFSFSMLMVYLQRYHYHVYGNKVVRGSRTIIKESLNMEMINSKEYRSFEKMIEDRNITSHEYGKHKSSPVLESAPAYCKVMQAVLKALKPVARN